jgi:hypothetical protein
LNLKGRPLRRPFCLFRAGSPLHLLTAAASLIVLDAFSARAGSRIDGKRCKRINSVDDSHAALEINSRSSYVPSMTIGV